MSAGPIKAERDARKPARMSTTNAARVCHRTTEGRARCGRRKVPLVDAFAATTCADCLAAARADGLLEEVR